MFAIRLPFQTLMMDINHHLKKLGPCPSGAGKIKSSIKTVFKLNDQHFALL